MSGFSAKYSVEVLGHTWGKKELAKPAEIALALCIHVPTRSSTGLTIEEATGATGYKRYVISAAQLETEEEVGGKSLIKNIEELIFSNITAGSAKIEGWALCDKKETGKGNVIMWGSCSSTEISTTQTPPTIGTGKLIGELA